MHSATPAATAHQAERRGSVSTLSFCRSAANFRCRLIAGLQIAFESLVDDSSELCGNRGIRFSGWQKSPVDYRLLKQRPGLSSDGALACCHFIKHQTKRKKICPRIELLATHLLR